MMSDIWFDVVDVSGCSRPAQGNGHQARQSDAKPSVVNGGGKPSVQLHRLLGLYEASGRSLEKGKSF